MATTTRYEITHGQRDYANTADGAGSGDVGLFLGAQHLRNVSDTSADPAVLWGSLHLLHVRAGDTAPPPGATPTAVRVGVCASNAVEDDLHVEVHRVIGAGATWVFPDNPWPAPTGTYTHAPETALLDADGISSTQGTRTVINAGSDFVDLLEAWWADPGYTTGAALALALLGRTDVNAKCYLRSYDNDPASSLYVEVDWDDPPTPTGPAEIVDPPSLAGTPQVGAEIEATPGTVIGTPPVEHRYRWFTLPASGPSQASAELDIAPVDLAGEFTVDTPANGQDLDGLAGKFVRYAETALLADGTTVTVYTSWAGPVQPGTS